MANYSIVGGGDGGCCQKMSKKSSLIGLVCTVIGVILSIVVYVITSSKLAEDQEAIIKASEIAEAAGVEVELANVWTREEVLSLLIGFLLGVLLMIVYIPVVLIEMGCCGCLGTVKETALKVAFEAKGKAIKVVLTVLSLVVFVLVVVYLVHGEIVVNKFDNLTSGILTIVAVVSLLLNLIMSIVYLRD